MSTYTGSGTLVVLTATIPADNTDLQASDVNVPFETLLDNDAALQNADGVLTNTKVAKAGDTMSGTLQITITSSNAAALIAQGGTATTGGPGAVIAAGGGNNFGAQITGHGNQAGVRATGGASSGVGMVGGGGGPDGVGVAGQGAGAGAGVQGSGDSTAGSTGWGGYFRGGDEGPGVYAQGGPTVGVGVQAVGGPGSAGVTGVGGSGSGVGGNFQATAGNSTGCVGIGHGTGAGGDFSAGGTAGASSIIGRGGPITAGQSLAATADPGGPGQLYSTNICQSWGQIESDGSGGSGVEDSYNLVTLALAGSGTKRFLLTFARPMANAFYSVNVTLHGTPGIAMKAVPFNLTANGFDIIIYNSTSVAQDPAGAAFNVSYQIFGRST